MSTKSKDKSIPPPEAITEQLLEINPSGSRKSDVTSILCALLQSPRFATHITNPAHQDHAIAAAIAIESKLNTACKDAGIEHAAEKETL